MHMEWKSFLNEDSTAMHKLRTIHLADGLFWPISFALFYLMFSEFQFNKLFIAIYLTLFHISLIWCVYSVRKVSRTKLSQWKKYILWLFIPFIGWGINTFVLDYLFPRIFTQYFFTRHFSPPELLLIHAIYVLFGWLLALSLSWKLLQQARESMLKLEAQKRSFQLEALKSQIQPHFFFNSLNAIYALTLEKSDEAPGAVLQLSHITRHVLYESRGKHISLQKEFAFIQNYIALQKLRLPSSATINIMMPSSETDHHIAPLLLLPLLENAFKHGFRQKGHTGYLRGAITVQNERLHLSIENDRAPKESRALFEEGGLGLQNLNERLQMLYPGQFSMQTKALPDAFRVELSIPVHKKGGSISQ